MEINFISALKMSKKKVNYLTITMLMTPIFILSSCTGASIKTGIELAAAILTINTELTTLFKAYNNSVDKNVSNTREILKTSNITQPKLLEIAEKWSANLDISSEFSEKMDEKIEQMESKGTQYLSLIKTKTEELSNEETKKQEKLKNLDFEQKWNESLNRAKLQLVETRKINQKSKDVRILIDIHILRQEVSAIMKQLESIATDSGKLVSNSEDNNRQILKIISEMGAQNSDKSSTLDNRLNRDKRNSIESITLNYLTSIESTKSDRQL